MPRKRRRVARSSGGPNKTLLWVGGLVLLGVIGFGMKFYFKSNADADVRQQMIALVHEFDNYSENAAYYDRLVDQYHREAFEAAYDMGSRRRSAKLNAKAYLLQISSRMAAKAEADGKADVAASLEGFHDALQEVK